MKSLPIIKGIEWIGAIDYDLRVFDIIMHTDFGTTYNSYLIEGSEKTALVETVKHTFTKSYVDYLKANKDLSKIDYLIVNHTEPDHAGTVAAIVELCPDITVIGSAAAIRFLKEIANCPLNYRIVDEGDSVSLGDKTLQFIMAPFLHWPDSMYTYIPEDRLLFTCDSFGSHYAFRDVFYSKMNADERSDYRKALAYYFNMIMGPFKKYMLKAIDKIEGLPIDYICNGHGPVLDEKPMEIVNQCKTWSVEKETKAQVVIAYVSAYGYTKELALKMAEGIGSVGQHEVKLYDLVSDPKGKVIRAIGESQGVLFGSPTINGDALLPIMEILIELNPIVHGGRLSAAFGSYGWSGEAVSHLSSRMKELRFRVMKGLKVNFKPTEDDLEEAFDYGAHFAKVLLDQEVFVSFDSDKSQTHNIEKEASENEDDQENRVMKKWICTVCQEVFEGYEPPEICAACGATKDQFEEYIEEEVEATVDQNLHVVIIGNGGAGITAAETIRRQSENIKITIVDSSSHPVYYKPMLSKFLGQENIPSTFFIHDHHWYEKNKIEFMEGYSLRAIEPSKKEVYLSKMQDDETTSPLSYDQLIIATGSHSFVPPIKNASAKEVFTLRTYDDALAIKAVMKESQKAIVIGGGLLGLEVAAQMHHGGMEVTVIEIMERLLPRQLDVTGASLLEEGFYVENMHVLTGCGVEKILQDENQHVQGVELSDGQRIEADLIIISAGVRTDTTIYEAAGIHCERGIIVDEHMKTSENDIYACGDCTVYDSINYSIWPEAMTQGKVAAQNAIGIGAVYENFVPSTILNAMGMQIFSIGEVNLDETSDISVLTYKDPSKAQYKRMNFKKEHLAGGIIIGDNRKSKYLIKGMKSKATLIELTEVLN